ncbi:MAG TPA: hypothetical protein PLO33_10805 [Kouleothrix sp.]|nr:hypothetical protein [Kouleothrix sp.]HRC76158.1 hypothetical protein [Kouleothrix sp.]
MANTTARFDNLANGNTPIDLRIFDNGDGTYSLAPGATASNPAQTKLVRSSTGTKTSVGASASSVTVLAANANRLGGVIYNDSTAILYLDCTGGTASSTSFSYFVAPGATVEIPAGYTGAITGIWSSATGNARVTEFT